MVMFGITQIVKGYSIQTYYLYCYAIFISEDITRQRGGVTFGTPCTFLIHVHGLTNVSRHVHGSTNVSRHNSNIPKHMRNKPETSGYIENIKWLW